MKKVVLKFVGWEEIGGSNSNDEDNNQTVTVVNYQECQKNQAAHLGKHAVDGCGEFMASGPEGTAALTCAACGCDRSDHREETTTVQAKVTVAI